MANATFVQVTLMWKARYQHVYGAIDVLVYRQDLA